MDQEWEQWSGGFNLFLGRNSGHAPACPTCNQGMDNTYIGVGAGRGNAQGE